MSDTPSPSPNPLCDGPLPPLVLHGLELFNAGEYFEAHEVLETAWRAERRPVRELYRGILQVGVGYYHLQRGNYQGALKMIERAKRWLAPFGERCRGINLAGFWQDFLAVEAELQRLGPEGIEHFNPRLIRPIEYESKTADHTRETL